MTGFRLALRVFLPFAAGYFLSYLYRTINAVIAPNLTADVGLDAATLGLLTSAYFLTFAAFQLPLGMLLDRFGPRRVEAALLLFAAAGAALFAAGESAGTLVAGRALIGLGVSACLMGAFKAFVLWYPPERLPLANGLIMAAGGIGALAATVPVEMALQYTDWRGLFAALAAATLMIAATLFFMVPEHPVHAAAHPGGFAEQLAGLGSVYRSALFWRVAPATALTQAAFLAIQGLWAGPWLRDVADLDRTAVAFHLSAVAIAMVVGFVVIGALAERLSRLGVGPLTVAGGGMFMFLLVQLAVVMELDLSPLLLWSLFGFFGTASILPYAALSQSFAPALAGRVNTSLNVLVFCIAFAGQWGIGALIGLWPVSAPGRYAPTGYQAGFGVALVLQTLAFLWLVTSLRGGAGRPKNRA